MSFLKKGTPVRVKRTTIVGHIAGYHVSANQEVITYVVNYKDPEGDDPDEMKTRSFEEKDVVVIEIPAKEGE